MAITLEQRIVDLAYSGLDLPEIVNATGTTLAYVQGVLQGGASPSVSKGGSLVEVGGIAPGVWGTGERAPLSSAQWPGAGVPLEVAAQSAGVGNWIAVPVVPGYPIKHVAVAGSKTAAATVAEYIVAVYEGKTGGALLAQSAATTPGSHPKEELYVSELEKTVTPTAATAPHGYVYVLVSAGSAGTMFGFIGLTYTTANQAILGVYGTAGVAANAIYNSGGTGYKTTAPATVPTLTAVAGVPIVALY